MADTTDPSTYAHAHAQELLKTMANMSNEERAVHVVNFTTHESSLLRLTLFAKFKQHDIDAAAAPSGQTGQDRTDNTAPGDALGNLLSKLSLADPLLTDQNYCDTSHVADPSLARSKADGNEVRASINDKNSPSSTLDTVSAGNRTRPRTVLDSPLT
jgi:hypothetical protein